MSVIDVNSLLNEISPDAPSGEDLEYDPAFGELDRAVQGKAEQVIGDSVVAAEPPDWREVRKMTTELLGRSKDLRIGVHLARALTSTDGLAGLADGLSLIRGLLERYWDSVHPQLDPDDGNDPTMRINILVTLVDRDAMLNMVHRAPLVSSRVMGRYSLYDIARASGGADKAPEGDEEAAAVPDMTAIDAAFMEADLEDVQGTADAVARCVGDLTAIDAVLMDKVGASQAPDMSALATVLKEAQTRLNGQLVRRGAGSEEMAAGDTAASAGGQPAAGAAAPARAISGDINSREDAIKMMEKISSYFERTEPSSPIPLLMKRAKRLVSMSFMDVLADMAPDGVKQAKIIGGIGKD